MNLAHLLQQGAPGGSGGAALFQLVPYLLIFGIFWFVLIAPMRKQQKQTRDMLSNLKKGDKVLTSGGLYGQVAQVDNDVVWLKIADQVKVKVAKSAITGMEKEPEAGKDKDAA